MTFKYFEPLKNWTCTTDGTDAGMTIGRREGEAMYTVIVYVVSERNVHELTERSLYSRECKRPRVLLLLFAYKPTLLSFVFMFPF